MESNVKYAGFWGGLPVAAERGAATRPLRFGLERRLVGPGRVSRADRPTRTPPKRSGRWPAQDLYLFATFP